MLQTRPAMLLQEMLREGKSMMPKLVSSLCWNRSQTALQYSLSILLFSLLRVAIPWRWVRGQMSRVDYCMILLNECGYVDVDVTDV